MYVTGGTAARSLPPLGKTTCRVRGLELKTIGKYEITAEIGRGAMGEVYKARDPLIGRMVALKVITSGLSSRPELLDRFYQEARSAGALQHPNIVTVYELGKEDELPFIAMEYLGGDSLEKIIARQAPLPLVEKVGYIVQICRALEYAHKHGVVHRDIKPGNIMTTSEGAIKVVDFGIARLVDASKTQTGTLIGTVGYMSPQQLRGEHADERSDIWAVGVLFYELLLYKRPFQGENPVALMMSIISEEAPPLGSSDAGDNRELEAIVSRMMKKEVVDRYQTMEEVLLDLDPVYRELQHSRVDELVARSEQLIEAQDLKSAQQLLREALHADSSHAEAKALFEKASRGLRHQQVLPKVKDQLAKAQGMLDAGQFQQAKAEVQAALQLDSTYQPARDLMDEVQRASERARELDAKLRVAKQRIAEGALTDADRQIDDMLSLDPQNPQAQELRRQIREEAERRGQRQHFSDAMRQARELWSLSRYSECIVALLELQKEFPGNAEIEKLLGSARHDQTEGEKQKRLVEARNLIASQQYEQARSVLTSLGRNFPADAAVQNLLALAQDEQAASARQQRLQQELDRLRSLVNEGKHAEALQSAEALRAEFPDDFQLTELIDFARDESRRADQDRRLQQAIDAVKSLMAWGSFGQAGQAAEQSLVDFPESAELKSLREEAIRKEQEKQRREEMDKRIREVKGRIEHKELTGAIELAQETIASLGTDTNVNELLKAAQDQRVKREEKKWRDLRLAQARSLLIDRKPDEAAEVVNKALAAGDLDGRDPDVRVLIAEIESHKRKRVVALPSPPPPAAPVEAAPAVPRGVPSEPAVSTPAVSKPAPTQAVSIPKPEPPTIERPASRKAPWTVAALIVIAAVIGGGIYFAKSKGKVPAPPTASQAVAPASNPAVPAPAASASNGAAPAPSTPVPATSAPAASSAVATPPATPAPVAPAAESNSVPQQQQQATQQTQKPAAQAARAQPARQSSPSLSASEQLRQLVGEYNEGTDDPDDLRKLQQEFRGLEKVNGTVGRDARLYAEQRIPADLNDLESGAPLPPPAAAPAATSTPVTKTRFVWVVSVDVSSPNGILIQGHPLPIALVAKAAASHNHFELQFTIDSQGRVTAGHVLSGGASLGQALVSEAVKKWHFSSPGQQSGLANVSVQF